MGSAVVSPGLSCSVACGIFLDQGPNSCLLYWQVDSHSLHHQGSPTHFLNLFDQRIFFFFHATSINIPWNMCYGNPGVHPYRGFSRQALLNFGSPLPLCSWQAQSGPSACPSLTRSSLQAPHSGSSDGALQKRTEVSGRLRITGLSEQLPKVMGRRTILQKNPSWRSKHQGTRKPRGLSWAGV